MVEQLQQFRIAAQTAAFALLALAAWRWGGGPERALAAILVWFRVADWTYHGVFQTTLELAEIDLAHFLIDGLACAAAFAVALYANRIYPLWFAAIQLLVVFAHLARELAMDIHPLIYAIGFMAPSYLQMVILAWGLWLHHRRVRRHGPYRSWRHSSNLSREERPAGWPNA